MIAIRISLEEASGTRDTITIHTDSMIAVKMLKTENLNSIQERRPSETRKKPAINWIPAHTGIPGDEKKDKTQRA